MEKIIDIHKKVYGEDSAVVATAPGRFHLIGEHSWFFKDKTLSMAVNLPVYVAVSKRSDSNLHFYFSQLNDEKKTSIASIRFKKEDKWANAIKSVIFGFNSGGFDCTGMNFTISSEILPSSGFGITTAIKIASAWAVNELCGFNASESDLLQVIERANRVFYGIQNHKADSFAAAFSRQDNFIVTDYNKGTYDFLPYTFNDRIVVLTDARVPRITTWNEEGLHQPENVLLLGELKESRPYIYGGWKYEDSIAERNEVLSVLKEDSRRRLLCIINEHKCVLDAVSAIQKSDFDVFARSVNSSYEFLRDYYDISCPEIDWLLKRVHELNSLSGNLQETVSCGRIMGKGFGRCTYTFLRECDLDKYKQILSEYDKIFGFKPVFYIVKPSEGVHLI